MVYFIKKQVYIYGVGISFMFSRGQGTIEYLVIIAVIIVISLVVVGLSTNLVGSPVQSIGSGASSLGSTIGTSGISVSDAVVDSSGNGIVSLSNYSGDAITLDSVSVGDSSNAYGAQLVSGDSFPVALAGLSDSCPCREGETKTKCVFVFSYTTSSGLSKSSSVEVLVDCVNNAVPKDPAKLKQPKLVSDVVSPSVELLVPADDEETFNSTVEFSASVSDNNALKSCSLLINGDDVNTNNSIDGNTTLSFVYDFGSGNYDVYNWDVNCVDFSGNSDVNGSPRTISYAIPVCVSYIYSEWGDCNSVNNSQSRTVVSALPQGCVGEPVLTQKCLPVNYIWVAGRWSNNVTKINTLTGEIIGTYSVGSNPEGVAVDENWNVWVANSTSDTVTKLNGSTGATMGTYVVRHFPQGIAADGNGFVWVATGTGVTKLSISNGAEIGYYAIGANNSNYIAVDSARNLWVSNDDGRVYKLTSSNGSIIGSYYAGESLRGVAVDADGNIWAVKYSNPGSVFKLNGSTGAIIVEYAVWGYPQSVAVDGNGNAWVGVGGGSVISKFSVSTGTLLGEYYSLNPEGVAIDGYGNVWVANRNSSESTVSKFDSSTGDLIGSYAVGNIPDSIGDSTGFALQYFVLGRR